MSEIAEQAERGPYWTTEIEKMFLAGLGTYCKTNSPRKVLLEKYIKSLDLRSRFYHQDASCSLTLNKEEIAEFAKAELAKYN